MAIKPFSSSHLTDLTDLLVLTLPSTNNFNVPHSIPKNVETSLKCLVFFSRFISSTELVLLTVNVRLM